MQMRLKLARTVTVAGFVAESAPTSASAAHVSLDDWVADLAAQVTTTGHKLRLRFLNAAGAEVSGGTVTLQVWAKASAGFWVADPQLTDIDGTDYASSSLFGDLFIVITSISAPLTATTLQILVREA